jgi:hypothetical protein
VSASPYNGGGGGGADGAGHVGGSSVGVGGIGRSLIITGTSIIYGGGGVGGNSTTNGASDSGYGGGGGGGKNAVNGLSGNTGVVILSYVSITSAPIVSFNIVLTDTSVPLYAAPTSWKWNATNLLGNNTEFTFSTAQNPIFNLGIGNWKISLTATNSLGSNTTSQIIGYGLSNPRVYFWNRTA